LEGQVIIRLLDRVRLGATEQDGGSDGAVITADHINLEPIKLEQLKKVPRQGGSKPAQLELSCRADEDGSQVISVTGELDIATAEQAYSYISEIIDGRETPVSVDLSALTFCDASGLGVLARVARHAREAGRQLRLTSARPSLLKIMRITGLDNVFPELRPSAPAYSALTDLEKPAR
jgi:anti-sigma B factor antagonist